MMDATEDRRMKRNLMHELKLVNLKRICRLNDIKVGRTKDGCINNILECCDRFSYGFEFNEGDFVMTIRMTL